MRGRALETEGPVAKVSVCGGLLPSPAPIPERAPTQILARTLSLKYSRIQFTPDLMPADIVDSMIVETEEHGRKTLRFQQWPIFANLVLADEINRATPEFPAREVRRYLGWGTMERMTYSSPSILK